MKIAQIRWLWVFFLCRVLWMRDGVYFSFCILLNFSFDIFASIRSKYISNDEGTLESILCNGFMELGYFIEIGPPSARHSVEHSVRKICTHPPYACRFNVKAMKWQTHATSCKITLLDSLVSCVCVLFLAFVDWYIWKYVVSSIFSRLIEVRTAAMTLQKFSTFQAGGINFK